MSTELIGPLSDIEEEYCFYCLEFAPIKELEYRSFVDGLNLKRFNFFYASEHSYVRSVFYKEMQKYNYFFNSQRSKNEFIYDEMITFVNKRCSKEYNGKNKIPERFTPKKEIVFDVSSPSVFNKNTAALFFERYRYFRVCKITFSKGLVSLMIQSDSGVLSWYGKFIKDTFNAKGVSFEEYIDDWAMRLLYEE